MSQPSYRTILRYYWTQMRKLRWYFAMVFGGYAIGNILVGLVMPLWYRHIIDVLSIAQDPMLAWPILVRYLFYIGATIIAFNIALRFGDFAITRFESRTMKDLMD